MRNRSWIAFLLWELLVGATLISPQAEAGELRLDHAWFTPSLTVNDDSICPSVLDAARKRFISKAPWSSFSKGNGQKLVGLEPIDIFTVKPGGGPADSSTAVTAGDLGRQSPVITWRWDFRESSGTRNMALIGAELFIVTGGTKLFMRFKTNPGCGGYCESEGVLVSTNAEFSADADNANAGPAVVETPGAELWRLYRSGDDAYYLVGVVRDHVQAYRVVAPKNWRLSCDVAVAPETLPSPTILPCARRQRPWAHWSVQFPTSPAVAETIVVRRTRRLVGPMRSMKVYCKPCIALGPFRHLSRQAKIQAATTIETWRILSPGLWAESMSIRPWHAIANSLPTRLGS